MNEMTITEALQEIKTIGKRLEKKRQAIGQYIARDSRVRDPFEKDGGSEKYVSEERQSITDLENRVIAIRMAIQSANLDKALTIGDTTRPVAGWLTWKREVANGQVALVNSVITGIDRIRKEVQGKGGKVVAAVAAVNESYDPNGVPDVVLNLDEKGLLKESEKLQETLGVLDGKLSLFNATTTVQF